MLPSASLPPSLPPPTPPNHPRQLADLLVDLIRALNDKEIPTGASLLESFNQQLVGRALAEYTRRMDAVKVPLSQEDLLKVCVCS